MASVAATIAQTLKAYDTKYFFQVTGGDQALWIALEEAGIQMIPCRSQKGATYMADGYARISGKPGFVYGQYGPGVSNVAAERGNLSPSITRRSFFPLSCRAQTTRYICNRYLDYRPGRTASIRCYRVVC